MLATRRCKASLQTDEEPLRGVSTYRAAKLSPVRPPAAPTLIAMKVYRAQPRASSRAKEERILADHYRPYRAEAQALVGQAVASGQRVIHVSSHSFTPRLSGQVRTADIGLLYDPARPGEVDLGARWKAALREIAPELRVRRNYPYAGKNDGLTSNLRRRYPPAAYVGIELEINQAHVIGAPPRWAELRITIVESLRMALM